MVLLSAVFVSAQSNSAEYPLTAHVISTHLNYLCSDVQSGSSFCLGPQQIEAVIGGKKFELAGGDYKHGGIRQGLLKLGDYKAKIAAENHKTPADFEIVYEFLLPDASTRKFAVVGETAQEH